MIKNSGQAFLLVIIVVAIVLMGTMALIGGATVYFQNALYSVNSEKAIALAEAGIDKALVALNKSGGSYNGETETILGDGSYAVTITNKNATTKIIEGTGFVPNKDKPKAKRTIRIEASNGVGVAFNYGLQVGEGGLSMGNGSNLNGSVYSNGSIQGSNNSTFTGDVWIAGGGQVVADQQSDCTPPNCSDFIFGKTVNGEVRLDPAQSVKPSVTGTISKVSIKLKKFGTPPNLTVRIMTDQNGEPSKTTLASGTLSASLVTSSYSFVDVTFTSSPTLQQGITYWLMIDTSSDSNNYWAWSNDLAQGYTRGLPAFSANWSASNPVWVAFLGDLGLKTYMGGVINVLNLGNGSLVSGNVHANTIQGVTIQQNAYYQTIINSTVQGQSFPNSQDPSPVAFPISDANINDWKSEAEQAGVTQGSLAFGNSCTITLGPGKITGSLSFGNGCNVTIKSPLWIAGALSAGNTTRFTLDSSFGASSGMIIVDGRVAVGNGFNILGSGTAGSYLMLVITYDSRSVGSEALEFGNSSISGILYAPYGKVELASGALFREISAWKIALGNTASLNYETGLAALFFTSGPGGSFSLVNGTYQIK